jgi:MFS family permease
METSTTKTSSLWAMLSALLIGTLIGTMGNSMVSIALTSFMDSFQVSLTSAVWSLTLYTLTFSVLIPVFGSLSTAIGYKRMFISGMTLVIAGSLSCILAPGFLVFLLARIMIKRLQGLPGTPD